jgi:hypothetical protein
MCRPRAASWMQPLRRSCATSSKPSCWPAMRPAPPCSCGRCLSSAGRQQRGSR